MTDTFIKTQKTARISTSGALNENTPLIWLVLHGYGQMSPYFIRHFKSLAENGHYIIAPEAMNRFYLNGNSGRIGASWMTREERERDIADYLEYLNNVAEHFSLQDKNKNIPLVLFGFSQGAATVCRWAGSTSLSPAAIVLWAGSFPPDLNWSLAGPVFQKTPVYFLLGDDDPYIKPEQVNTLQDDLLSKNIHLNLKNFSGGHQIVREPLDELAKNILMNRKSF